MVTCPRPTQDQGNILTGGSDWTLGGGDENEGDSGTLEVPGGRGMGSVCNQDILFTCSPQATPVKGTFDPKGLKLTG